MENEKDMSEKKSEAEIVISATPSETTESKEKSSSGLAKFAGFVLLVLIIIGGGLAANGQLMPLLESLQSKLASQQSSEPAVVATEEESEPVYQPAPQPAAPEAVTEAVNIAASAEAEALLSTIEQLRGELQSMEASQKSLQNGLLEQQQMNLQVRLRWITDPASRAPQIQLAWEEISLLPGLSDAQRSQAESMQALARATVQSLRDWQASLHKWADALSTPVHEDIIPTPEHPWLAWITGQFHLRQAPTQEARRLGSLRERLLNASRSLTLESWPTDGEWQSLHAELLLQVKAMHADSSDSATDLGLPENFAAIQKDLNSLRESARLWSQTPKGEF